MNILVIKDDKPGHYNQTEGLLLGLKELYPKAYTEYCEIEIKSKLSRKLLRILLNTFPSFFQKSSSKKYIKYFYKKFDLPNKQPDLIISTGGNTASLNVWLAKLYHAKNILNGKLRGLNEDLFTKVTTVIDLGYKNQIIIDVAPNTITSHKLDLEAKKFAEKNNLNETYYALLIGGNGAGYSYDDKFYEELIDFVINMARNHKIKWLITTSRRTPLEIEEKIKKNVEEYCAYFVAYNEKPEKILLPFLGLSKSIFVTEESSSMISEAISARKEVHTLYKNDTNEKQYKKILEKFQKEKKIVRINLEKEYNKYSKFNIPNIEYNHILAAQLKEEL